MKKALAFMLTLALLLAPAGAARAASYTVEHAFTIVYPDDLDYDNTGYVSNNDDTYVWLVDLFNDDFVIEVTMNYYEDWSDFSLFSAADDEALEYLEITLGDYGDGGDSCEYVETLYTDEDNIPFLLMSVNDADFGEYYHAETMANGWVISFDAYSWYEGEPVTDECREALYAVVKSLAPLA